MFTHLEHLRNTVMLHGPAQYEIGLEYVTKPRQLYFKSLMFAPPIFASGMSVCHVATGAGPWTLETKKRGQQQTCSNFRKFLQRQEHCLLQIPMYSISA